MAFCLSFVLDLANLKTLKIHNIEEKEKEEEKEEEFKITIF